jgi:cysteine synthase A
MLLKAIRENKINKDTVVIEATSGNTGISIASLCSSLGIKSIIVMNDSVTKERIKYIELLGAEVVLVKSDLGMNGCVSKAIEIQKSIENSYILNQFNNIENVMSHFETTGKEIYEALDGNIDFFVSGIGTGGTITGVGKYLKMKNPKIKVIGIEPKKSSAIKLKNKGTHTIYGIGAGFVPSILNIDIIDDIYLVDDVETYESVMKFIKEEGILVGVSSGAALSVAYKLQKKYGYDKNIVCVLPDSGNRYLSIF